MAFLGSFIHPVTKVHYMVTSFDVDIELPDSDFNITLSGNASGYVDVSYDSDNGLQNASAIMTGNSTGSITKSGNSVSFTGGATLNGSFVTNPMRSARDTPNINMSGILPNTASGIFTYRQIFIQYRYRPNGELVAGDSIPVISSLPSNLLNSSFTDPLTRVEYIFVISTVDGNPVSQVVHSNILPSLWSNKELRVIPS